MKKIIKVAHALTAAAVITTGVQIQAETITYSAKTGSLLKISGTSSVHDWEVKTLLIDE